MQAVIQAPQGAPSRHGLVGSAFTSPAQADEENRWENGFQFLPEHCAEPESWLIPCVGDGSDPGPGAARTEQRGPTAAVDVLEFTPYQVRMPYKCDAQTYAARPQSFADKAVRGLELGQSKLIETELWRGDAAGFARSQATPAFNRPNLTLASTNLVYGTTPVPDVGTGGGAAPSIAIRSLVQSAANSASGRQCMIHCTVATAMAWMQSGSIRATNAGTLRTTVGDHIVIAGAGYTGEASGLGAPSNTIHTAYITTPVYLLLGDIQVLWEANDPAAGMDRAANDYEVIAQRTACAYWDGCFHAALEVDITGTYI